MSAAARPVTEDWTAPTIAAPATLPTDVRAYVTSQPDALLVAWLSLSPQAVEVLSERERTHALGLLVDTGSPYTADYRTGQCAAYLREQLVCGDHVKLAARLALDVGAVLVLDGVRYTIAAHRGRTYRLRGPAGGRVDLTPPLTTGNVWSAWIGGTVADNAKLRHYRRQPDGSFVRVKF